MKSAVVAVVLLVCLVGASAVPTHLFPKANSVRVPDMHDKRVFWELPLAREQVVTENLAETLRIASEDAPDNDLSDKYSFLETAMGLTSRTQVGKVMGACKDCIFFLERVKKGINDWLPSICSELYAMHGSDEESADYDFSKVCCFLSIYIYIVFPFFFFFSFLFFRHMCSETVGGALSLAPPTPSHSLRGLAHSTPYLSLTHSLSPLSSLSLFSVRASLVFCPVERK